MAGCVLGRQSQLKGLLFQFCQIGIRIATEAGAQDAGLASVVEPLAEFGPPLPIDAAQISPAGWMLAGGHSGDQAPLTAQNEPRRGHLAPARPPLGVALRAELMLKIVVGARQVRNAVAVEQAGAIAAADCAEVRDRLAQVTGAVARADRGADQSIEPALHRGGVL